MYDLSNASDIITFLLSGMVFGFLLGTFPYLAAKPLEVFKLILSPMRSDE